MGIFGNFYTKQGEFLTARTGIPGGPDWYVLPVCWQVDNTRSGHTEIQHSYVE